uniref:Uncharacterized protein n=1 Tax=Salix viminalis TaxID=40686 RepID=A0A6N2KNA1_SALVM
MAIPLSNGLRALFLVLGCLMVATLTYTIYVDGSPFRRDLLTPWMIATLVDFYINTIALATWISYKESNFITATVWIVLLICSGSITTCAYIFLQLLKLSPEESLQDPLYHVLLRQEIKGVEQKTKQSAVVTLRIAFSILGFLMLGTLIYTLITDGSPFRKELLTPWMTATLIDFYINVVALSVGLGCLQGIKLDQCIRMDTVIDLLWKHYYERLHRQTAAAAYFSRSSLPDLIQ